MVPAAGFRGGETAGAGVRAKEGRSGTRVGTEADVEGVAALAVAVAMAGAVSGVAAGAALVVAGGPTSAITGVSGTGTGRGNVAAARVSVVRPNARSAP